MKTILVLALLCPLLFAGCVRPYVEGGLSVHHQGLAEPETCFPHSTLGTAEIGVSRDGWDLYLRHVSDPSTFEEEGYGINSVGVSKRIYLFGGGE